MSLKILDSNYEDLCIEVFVKNKRLLFYTLYRPPNSDINFNSYFSDIYSDIDISFYDFICVLGDFNFNFMPKNNRLTKEANVLKEVLLSYGLKQIIEIPTFPSADPKSILDLVFINSINLINKLQVIPIIFHYFPFM